MDTERECICCNEIEEIREKQDELKCMDYSQDSIPKCIIDHPGFNENCTAIWALQTAYFAYQTEYGRDKYSPEKLVLHPVIVIDI